MERNISYGILLFDKPGNKVLLVRRKYTYAFYNYVMNIYEVNKKSLMSLFNAMTIQEKRLIYQFNYELLWNTLWMEKDGISMVSYYKNKRVNEKIVSNSKKLILECLYNCENLGDEYCNLWSIPKGKKNTISEKDIEVAKREFEEETNIPSSKYILYADFKRKCNLDNGYKLYYYIARYKNYCPIKLQIKKDDIPLQFMEINGIEWMNLDQISKKCPYLKKHLKPAFNYFRRWLKL